MPRRDVLVVTSERLLLFESNQVLRKSKIVAVRRTPDVVVTTRSR
jgi:hypothetical protein